MRLLSRARLLPVLAVAGTLTFVLSPVADAGTPATGAGRVIVKWAPGLAVHASAVRAHDGLRHRRTLPLTGAEVLSVPAGRSAEATARLLAADPAVEYAQADHVVHVATDDPGYGVQWGLRNTGQVVNNVIGVAGMDADVPAAWPASEGAGVTVAVVDTGVDTSHPDLAGQTVAGWDVVDNTSTVYTSTDSPHGTHVTGIVAMAAGNGLGGAGVAPAARVMPVKFMSGSGSGSTSDAVTAIGWAVQHGAQVVNMSWGGPDNDPAVYDAIASAPNVVFVAAAGNDGVDIDTTPTYPASYHLPNLISVAALTSSGGLASYSDYGAQSVALAAPGSNILSTYPGAQYAYMSGTSMATPFVSGVAALVRAAQPSWSAAQVVTDLEKTVQPLGSLTGRTLTGGMVDAAAAVAAATTSTTGGTTGGSTSGSTGGSTGDTSGGTTTTSPSPSPSPSPTTSPSPSPSPTTSPAPTGSLACPASLTASQPFSDVASTDVHAGDIACVAGWGIAQGLTPTTFGPGGPVSRAQLASFLARVLTKAGVTLPTTPDAFVDDNGDTHEADIAALSALGIVRGVTATRFEPLATVTRAQMASFLVRTYDFLTGTTLTASRTWFTDDAGDAHQADIEAARQAGLVSGVTATTYAPMRTVTREQMASFVANLLQGLVAAGSLAPLA